MRRMLCMLITMLLALAAPGACAQTRALLVACSDFVTQADLGSAISGNLHMVGSALISGDVAPGSLSIEDGTVTDTAMLGEAVHDAFGEAQPGDLSILYLCTHGVISSSDDNGIYLLLGDGKSESPLSAAQLFELLQPISGEKLLIIDACYSGALIGRGLPQTGLLPGSRPPVPENPPPFLCDPTIHVLTSSNGRESSWYYDSEKLSTGAVSYFASALASGLGLYGRPEADLDGDGQVSLAEMHRHLNTAVPSSSAQLLSSCADDLLLPVADRAMLPRPLSGFSYGISLLTAEDPTLDFSFTVTREGTAVQYRLVEYADGVWDWAGAQTFFDEDDSGNRILSAGRKTRALSLDLKEEDSGYLMLQVFSVSGEELILCSERLIAIQPGHMSGSLRISAPGSVSAGSLRELPIDVYHEVPTELTVSIFSDEGVLVRRLASSQLTRPSPENAQHFYWDGRDADGMPVPAGQYTAAAEMRIGGERKKAVCGITLTP